MPNPQNGRSPEVEHVIDLWKRKRVMSRIGIDQLIAHIATLEAAHAWQADNNGWALIESAPKDGTTILLFRKHSHQYIHNRSKDGLYYPCRWVNGRWSGWAHRAADYPPTHWMPLPAAPQIAEGGSHE